ncbi:MAG: glycosyltransferase [Planctomycetota bacterium]|nr:glycosyltransferase [Planctomycetota bacterium]
MLCFFDEEGLLPGLPGLLDEVRVALAGHEVTFLAVDDGSGDGTAKGLAAIPALAVATHETNRGVGAAMTTGLERADGDAAVVYDPDAAYAPESLTPLVDALTDADVATLSPYHPDGGVEGVGALRLFLSRCASTLYRHRLKSSLHTFTCAVRAYRLPAARKLLPAPDDFTAGAYLLARALKEGLRVAEVPAVLRVRRAGKSKMKVVSTIRAHLRLLRQL